MQSALGAAARRGDRLPAERCAVGGNAGGTAEAPPPFLFGSRRRSDIEQSLASNCSIGRVLAG